MDYFDLSDGKWIPEAGLPGTRFLVIAFKSDWLYPAYQSREIVRACKLSGVDATYCELNSSYGHDAFLLETAEQGYLVKHFIANVSEGNGNGRA